MNWSIFATYALLTLAIFALWLPRQRELVFGFYALSVVMGLVSGVLDWRAVPFLALFIALVYYHQKITSQAVRIVVQVLILVFAVLFMIGAVPGFHNYNVIKDYQFAADSFPFSMDFNYDKVSAGLFLVLFCVQMSKTAAEWRLVIKTWLVHLAIVVPLILIFSYLLGYVRFDPKIPAYLGVWMFNNLVFVCLAEEGLFRGFIQNAIFKNSNLGLAVASILFGAAHYLGGWKYMILAAFAGFFYGRAYQKSGKLEAAMLTHFGLNTLHLLLFSYPALIGSL